MTDVYNRNFLGAMTGDAAVLDELNPVVQVAQTSCGAATTWPMTRSR